MTRFFLFLLFAALLHAGSCTDTQEKLADPGIPVDSVMSPEKLALVLSDIQIIRASQLNERNAGVVPTDHAVMIASVLSKHHITPGMFDLSMQYYRKDPGRLMKIYDRVTIILEESRKRNVPAR